MGNEIIQLGMRDVWGGSQPFGISRADRRQHLYVIGRSGTGKSTMLQNMTVQDMEAGHGLAFIDPHGDIARGLLSLIPPHRINDVVYFDPADIEYPIGLNLLRPVSQEHRHLICSGIVSAFKGLWRDSWGPRLEYILSMTIAALLECENVSLLSVQRVLSDSAYRTWVVKQVKDPLVSSFWLNEFENYGTSFMQEAIAPIQNKVGQLLMSPQLRNILGQVKSRFDARMLMDNKRIFIADVSKGKLGEDKSNLIGAFLVTQFQLAAMSRADIPEHERQDFFLYVDEFQSFTSNSFISILSEARKYRLCLTLSHQYIDQVPAEIRNAVFGNVGSIVTFRVGQTDADILENEFGRAYSANQFTGLDNHEVCVKMLVEGRYGDPFLGKTMPPTGRRHDRGETIIKWSRDRYATKREIVEGRIKRWLEK